MGLFSETGTADDSALAMAMKMQRKSITLLLAAATLVGIFMFTAIGMTTRDTAGGQHDSHESWVRYCTISGGFILAECSKILPRSGNAVAGVGW